MKQSQIDVLFITQRLKDLEFRLPELKLYMRLIADKLSSGPVQKPEVILEGIRICLAQDFGPGYLVGYCGYQTPDDDPQPIDSDDIYLYPILGLTIDRDPELANITMVIQ